MLETLDYARPPQPPPSRSGGVWAMSLASAVALVNWAGFFAGRQSGGSGFAEMFPCFCLLMPASLLVAGVALAPAAASIRKHRGRDVLGWLAVPVAVAGAVGAWQLFQLAGEAVASV